ncbi:hypothetical protein OCGS_0528 [Oceaniovalibus guishaninsula JLT2003]|uniref:AAA+ family ATPase n=1 Tax=Oceaniovalibus guishaninsula JLT2003 TaxID=1231392 RepID=K2HDA5_9RHOB|nr:hypothetical protein [Oceaniovalibus guishaninsula]EKE45438.1 hypothetical protein OCGS_0528 [Oceaniovalibus guishaninsula JLT2003]
MKRILLVLALGAVASPLAAQQPGPDMPQPDDRSDIDEGLGLLSDGARRLLRGLMGEVEPQMRDLAEALKEWDFQGITVDDLSRYHPPEVLPNGDIIIRRKEKLTPVPQDIPEGGEVEL